MTATLMSKLSQISLLSSLVLLMVVISKVSSDTSTTILSGSVKSQAEQKMQQQFLFLLSAVADSVDSAVFSIKKDLDESNIRKQSYGWALVAGGLGDSLSDYVDNSRSPSDILTMPDVIYSYGYNIGYGLGFGGPFLLPTYLADTQFDCSSLDFLSVVSDYQYSLGVPQGIGATELENFGYDAKQRLHCVLQHSGDYAEAAKVGYLIDDLVDAGHAVVNLRT
jgi:hypothetical protein